MTISAVETDYMNNRTDQGSDFMNPEEQKAFDREVARVKQEELSRNRTRGYIIKCDGEHAVVSAIVNEHSDSNENYWAVGQLVSIKVGLNRVVGLTCHVDSATTTWDLDAKNELHITLELLGEIVVDKEAGEDRFSSGISNYPQMGCIAHRIRSVDLAAIYKSEGDSVVKVGSLTQDASIDAKIDVDKLLSRHFAVVGTTGVGKSTSVTLMMRKIIKARPDIRILMLDPHNEFASAFPDKSVVIDASNLVLPFWLFTLDEFAEVIFRGQDGFDAEVEILNDLVPKAKEIYRTEAEKSASSLSRKRQRSGITPDMPIPYRLADLIKLIDERLGLLDTKAQKPALKSLLYRLESVATDPRFRFMFETSVGGDIMESVMSNIFRVPQNDRPICVLEMSGLPSEVVNSVVSVLCRMAFELAMASDGGIQTLVVCEEAHRYIPANKENGFWPTRQAIARIAKEGRKYGVYLSIITQRPGELDPTILSQCNTLFAMRLGNQNDQEIIRGAVSNGAKSTISFLSSIANRECIAFGEAIHTPMRMTFETMQAKDLPGSRIYEQQAAVRQGFDISMSAVLRRLRHENDSKPTDNFMPQDIPVEQPQVQNERIAPQHVNHHQPGDEINSIMNAAYNAPSRPNHSASGNGMFGGSSPTMQQTRTQPVAPSPPQPRQMSDSGSNNLISNFRRK